MTQIATVRNIRTSGMAEVQIKRKTACGHDCSKCGGGCTEVLTKETVLLVKNDMDARPGDLVMIESQSSKILRAAMIVYILPFFLFFVGYFSVNAAFSYPHESLPTVGGLLGFFLGIVAAVLWDRREKKKQSLQFRMIDIMQRCSDT